jgi:hypothetical protein
MAIKEKTWTGQNSASLMQPLPGITLFVAAQCRLCAGSCRLAVMTTLAGLKFGCECWLSAKSDLWVHQIFVFRTFLRLPLSAEVK